MELAPCIAATSTLKLLTEVTEAMPTIGFAGPALTRRRKWKVWCVALSWSALGPTLPAGPVSYGL